LHALDVGGGVYREDEEFQGIGVDAVYEGGGYLLEGDVPGCAGWGGMGGMGSRLEILTESHPSHTAEIPPRFARQASC